VGLKGATRSTTAGDASTTANAVSEERSEPPESNGSGLSRCSQMSQRSRRCIRTRLLADTADFYAFAVNAVV